MGTDTVTITKNEYTDIVNHDGINSVHDSDAPGPVWEARGYVLVADGENASGSRVQRWERKGKAWS